MKKYDNVPNFPGYFVSKYGKVYSRKLEGSPNKFTNVWKEIVVRPNITKRGRIRSPRLKLFNQDGPCNISLSRLVAIVWVYNPFPDRYNEVMHLDNDPTNNFYKNLQWGDHSLNMQQMIFEGRRKEGYQKGVNIKVKSGSELEKSIIEAIHNKEPVTAISKRLNITRKTLYNTRKRLNLL